MRRPLVVRVAPDVKGIDRLFDYAVPPDLEARVDVGTVVRLPLGRRRVRGWVVEVGVEPPEGVDLRDLAKVTGLGPPPDLVELAVWAAWRWAGRLSHFLVPASPATVVERLPPAPPPALVPGPVDPVAEELLAGAGGVHRLPPPADRLPVVLAACRRGPSLVLTPSVDDAGVLAVRLRRAGVAVASYPRHWAEGAAGATVVGTQAAAWAPVDGLGSVVVLDEHDEALQHESAPTWHAREVAIERARRAGVPCVLVSPTPSLDALSWAAGSRRPVLVPTRVEERAGWPVVQVVDRTREEPWEGSPLAPSVRRILADPALVVVCVLNAPGRARRLACRSCRSTTRCEACGAAVGQTPTGVLRCGRCGRERPVVCQECGGTSLVPVRMGVSGLRALLESAAGRPVAEVTGATPPDQPVPGARVLIGTEAVLHRVARADVVVFLDFDAELLAGRFRAAEQALALVARAARVVGGRGEGGRVMLQTRLPRHAVVDAALHADPTRLVEVEEPVRRELGFPPFGGLAVVEGPAAAAYAEGLRALDALRVVGPSAGRWLVRASTWEALADGLAAVARPPGRLRIEVDPRRL